MVATRSATRAIARDLSICQAGTRPYWDPSKVVDRFSVTPAGHLPSMTAAVGAARRRSSSVLDRCARVCVWQKAAVHRARDRPRVGARGAGRDGTRPQAPRARSASAVRRGLDRPTVSRPDGGALRERVRAGP